MPIALQEILCALTKSKIDLIMNQNRSTMIRILERRRRYTKLSIHEMFLEAPNDVVKALALLIKNEKSKESSKIIHQYIEKSAAEFDERPSLDLSKLITQGKRYNLIQLYENVNRDYFSSKLKLHITWFGSKTKLPKRLFSFGLYHHSLKLIKINWLLDILETPEYFIEYIIYHEMLHEIYRPILKENGHRSIHTREFKEKEKLFLRYNEAQAFARQFKNVIFK